MNFYKSKSATRGFTLIELLVVIAIIAVLSAIVLASLGQSKSKANDGAVKSNFTSVRSQAELYYITNKNFGTNGSVGDCTTTTTLMNSTAQGSLKNIIADMQKNAGGAANVRCFVTVNGTAWGIAAALSSGYACIDSSNTLIASSTGTFANAMSTTTSTVTCNR